MQNPSETARIRAAASKLPPRTGTALFWLVVSGIFHCVEEQALPSSDAESSNVAASPHPITAVGATGPMEELGSLSFMLQRGVVT